MYNTDHSNNHSGSNHEDVPYWTRLFLRVSDGIQEQETANQRTTRVRKMRGIVVASIIGHQAPLGSANDGPVKLCTEMSCNMCCEVVQQIIRDINAECIELRNNATQISTGMEGRDDSV